jgi:hypothetical protein
LRYLAISYYFKYPGEKKHSSLFLSVIPCLKIWNNLEVWKRGKQLLAAPLTTFFTNPIDHHLYIVGKIPGSYGGECRSMTTSFL